MVAIARCAVRGHRSAMTLPSPPTREAGDASCLEPGKVEGAASKRGYERTIELMARPNYSGEKRRKDLAKKAKKEEKRLRKLQAKENPGSENEDVPESTAAEPEATEG